MKNFLNNNPHFIVFLVAFSMFGMLLIMIISFINKIAYRKIVSLYTDKYSRLPITAALAKEASLIATPGAYFAKIGFIMETLMLPYNKISNHDMTKEQYDYINSLPKKLTIGFKIEAVLWIISIPAMIVGLTLHAIYN
ncbi:TPA: hypothetical protein I4G64_03775 [Enterobacter cloacae]|nr:hypothetical protein [Enterobacter pasteurii]